MKMFGEPGFYVVLSDMRITFYNGWKVNPLILSDTQINTVYLVNWLEQNLV